MGKNSGGLRDIYREGGKNAFSRAVDKLENAIRAKSKDSISSAKATMKKLISKMSDDVVIDRAKSFSQAAWLTRKENNPPSQYYPDSHKYNLEMSKLYNSEANKRRRKSNK